MNSPANMILWKKKKLNKPITLEPFGYSYSNHCSCTGLSLTSQFLSSLKLALENKFSSTSNSHRLHTATMITTLSKGLFCNWFILIRVSLYTIPYQSQDKEDGNYILWKTKKEGARPSFLVGCIWDDR